MSKHTPGPWRVSNENLKIIKRDFREIGCNDGELIASTCGHPDSGFYPSEEQAIANAQLIAAAPELLDALRWYEAQAKNMGKAAIHSDSKTLLSIMHEVAVDYGKRARAAITKATGVEHDAP